jgi:tetratricopeptide (TPR) repeat protein
MRFYVLTVFSFLLTGIAIAQDLRQTIRFADDLFITGDIASASRAYQRALFFSDGSIDLYLFKKLAEVHYRNKDYENAQKYFGLAYDNSPFDSLRYRLLFEKAACQILNENYELALIDLFTIPDTSEIVRKRLDFYLGTAYFGMGNFIEAKKHFEAAVDPADREKISELFSTKNLSRPSPSKAKTMSMILPGLGQTYSGDMKAGANSLLLTSGLIALFIHISIKYRFIDGLVTVLPWYQRYYTGGFGRAELIASEKRKDKRSKVYSETLFLMRKSQNTD